MEEEPRQEFELVADPVLTIQTVQGNRYLHHTDKPAPATLDLVDVQVNELEHFTFYSLTKGPQWPSGEQVWHLISHSHLCIFRLPQATGLRTCPSKILAVQRDVKPQISL